MPQLRRGKARRGAAGREGSSAAPHSPSPHAGLFGFQLFLAETESCLQDADSSSDSYLLLQQTCLVLRSQMCCASNRVSLPRNPFLPRVWC